MRFRNVYIILEFQVRLTDYFVCIKSFNFKFISTTSQYKAICFFSLDVLWFFLAQVSAYIPKYCVSRSDNKIQVLNFFLQFQFF